MIGRLRGTLVGREGTELLIDVGGVGYEVNCSTYTAATLPELGAPLTLRIFTHALESKITLYGFGSGQERELFDLLITVKNVGPSSAMGILSGGASPEDLARLIAAKNSAALTKIKGVGKKTAELIGVELHEKAELALLTWGASGVIAPSSSSEPVRTSQRLPILDDVAGALVQLGWRSVEADKAVADLAVAPTDTIESLLRHALRSMPR